MWFGSTHEVPTSRLPWNAWLLFGNCPILMQPISVIGAHFHHKHANPQAHPMKIMHFTDNI